MDDNYVNEVNMEVGIGEELDYEANDNIEHEEEAADKVETNQHERIVTEVTDSFGEKGECKVNSAAAERTKEKPEINENTNEAQSNNVSEPKKQSVDGDAKSHNKQKEDSKNSNLASIRSSEHTTRDRRRGVSDKPSGKSTDKPPSATQSTKSGEREPHRSGTQSQRSHRHSSEFHKSHRPGSGTTHRPSSGTTHRPSSGTSHRPSSGTSHRSRSPLRIRLSDYYEVSSIGHCDTSGVRLRSLANGVHKSSSSRDAGNNPSEDKSSHRKSQHRSSGSKPADKVENSIVEDKSESLSRVSNPVNGSSNQEPDAVNLKEDHDLNNEDSTKSSDVDKVECVNQSSNNLVEAKDSELPTNDAAMVPASAMET